MDIVGKTWWYFYLPSLFIDNQMKSMCQGVVDLYLESQVIHFDLYFHLQICLKMLHVYHVSGEWEKCVYLGYLTLV